MRGHARSLQAFSMFAFEACCISRRPIEVLIDKAFPVAAAKASTRVLAMLHPFLVFYLSSCIAHAVTVSAQDGWGGTLSSLFRLCENILTVARGQILLVQSCLRVRTSHFDCCSCDPSYFFVIFKAVDPRSTTSP